MIGKTISHYKIVRKVGSGGMGVIYQAEDTNLDRFVALKFLPQEYMRDEETRNRFILEAKAASSLQHRNVCTIHDIDVTKDGQMFICMDYYAGETLKNKIETGPMSIDESIHIAMEIGNGLSAAHEKKLIHRDIKPANIFITDKSEVIILDFGLAKTVTEASLSNLGTTLGTVPYMSPEQSRGKEVDHRTDIWSLGVLLYEMVTGQRPFKGAYDQAVIYSILNEEPDPVSSLREDAPLFLKEILGKTFAKDPENRYQNIQEMVVELKNSETPVMQTVSDSGKKAIVVLPFDDLSKNSENEYFSDGLTDEVIFDLSQVNDLRVISRPSAMSLKGTQKTIQEIGSELDIQYALVGSIRIAGDQLRINAQLIEASDERQMWAEKYNGTIEAVFDIQEKVAQSIVQAMKVKLSPAEEKKITDRPITDVKAYESYLKAKPALFSYDEKTLLQAENEIENAMEIAGESEILYAAMGWIYERLTSVGVNSAKDYLQMAEDYARKIFDLNSHSFYGYSLRGLINHFQGNLKEAVLDLKQANIIDPNDADVLHMLSFNYLRAGQGTAARPLINKLIEIDPLSSMTYSLAGFLDSTENNFNDGLEKHKKMYELSPNSPASKLFYAWSLALNGMNIEAAIIVDLLVKDQPDTNFARLGLFIKHSINGDDKKAHEVITPELIKSANVVEYQSRLLAEYFSLLKENDKALKWLENSVNLGFINYHYLSEYNPNFENIRDDAGYKKLMKKVKEKWEQFDA